VGASGRPPGSSGEPLTCLVVSAPQGSPGARRSHHRDEGWRVEAEGKLDELLKAAQRCSSCGVGEAREG